MFWFGGSVNEAIVKSKNEKKVFVVFICGNDEISNKMNCLYESLSPKLSDLPLVAIKLESESDNCKLFSQIYPVILIPSTYFIDSNGVAIEIIGGSVEDQNILLEKINETIEIFNKSLSSNSKTQNISRSPETCAQNTVRDAANDSKLNPNSSDSTPSAASTSSLSSSPPSTSSPAVPETEALEAKVERANRLIEEIRKKKAKEEEEKERLEEIERRKGMKEMLSSKRLREDKEAQEVIQEREREKRADKLAKERVLAQIAADREERRARNVALSETTKRENDTQKSTGSGLESVPSSSTQVRQRVDTKARIQFRLPDGSAKTNVFEANDSLETVRQYVSTNLNVFDFVLSTTFPRKEFAPEEYSQTLAELSLSPSSVLLIIPKSRANSSRAVTSPSILWKLLSTLLSPFAIVWNLMTSFFGSSNSSYNSNQREVPNEGTARRTAPKPKQKQFYNKDGNVARIRDPTKDDDEEDNNTWNGNSTQQM